MIDKELRAKIGILMLETTFPRIKGDIGNPETFPFPVRYAIVQGATVSRVVHAADPALLTPFIEAAQELEAEGVQAITTSCGFLSLFQDEIAQAVKVPFFSSSLLQIPLIYTLTGKRGAIGVLTAKKETLSTAHLAAAGADGIPLVIGGMEESTAFRQAILEGATSIDPEAIEKEVLDKVQEIVKGQEKIQALVLECTNLPPYRMAVQRATGLPVFDIVTFTEYIYASLG